MDGMVDLRSDTFTKPSAAMRAAMADAEVGDDGWGEDPTVNRLEEAFAARLGKEAALLVPSGTMANQVALRTLAGVGRQVVAGRRQHVVMSELGAAGANGAYQLHTVDDRDGRLDPATLREVVVGDIGHSPPVACISVENTHMCAGGRVRPPEELDEIAALGPAIHLDGARLFNAEVALGVRAARLAEAATTVMCCMSKGLGAPIGSLLAASADLVAEAREHRTRLGGGMRQAGVIAAAGLLALEENVDRLVEDHARARRLAEAVAERWPGAVDPATVDTNIVLVPHDHPDRLVDHLRGEGVLAAPLGVGTVRLVTHLDVDDGGIDRAVAALRSA